MRDMLPNSTVQQFKERLEHNAAVVFQENWKNRLDKKVRSNVRSFKEHDKISTLLKVAS